MSQGLVLGSSVQLYDVTEVQRAMDSVTGADTNGLRRVYTKMLSAGPSRFVSTPASSDGLADIAQQCPHFTGVLDDLANYVELSRVRKGGFAMQPILLAGDPGVGKTFFAKCLADALSLQYQFISMGTMSAGWVLSGSAPTWSGARHGKVAEALIDSQFANPLYLLDELDKTGGDSRYDPYGALLQLMEGSTAKHFKDEFLDVALDMSRVLWVATANDPARIPDHILSRMAVYEVPAPAPEQARHIAGNIYATMRAEHDWAFPELLESDTLDALSTVSPRAMQKMVLDGMVSTVRHRKERLEPSAVGCSHVKSSHSMGFLN